MNNSLGRALPAAVWWALHDLPVQLLPADMFEQTVDYLSTNLWALRLPAGQAPTSLYQAWAPYVEPFVAFVARLVQAPVLATRPGLAVDCLWKLFQPFILPAKRGGTQPVAYPPWSTTDLESAGVLVASFVRMVGQCYQFDATAMDAFWGILMTTMVKDAAPHVLPIMYASLEHAPWAQWVVSTVVLDEVCP